MSGSPKDFLVSRQEKEAPSEEAQFTWMGPVGTTERFRLLVTREDGDDVSVLPIQEARFKKGVRAWRWDSEEGEDYEVYVTLKTTARRIDLRRVAE